jgi:hypothetical protein
MHQCAQNLIPYLSSSQNAVFEPKTTAPHRNLLEIEFSLHYPSDL